MRKKSSLCCASCGRFGRMGPDGILTITYQGKKWCASCSAIRTTTSGATYVSQPSPGEMLEEVVDPLIAWQDCYSMTPKKRILVRRAKAEIQRAWTLWSGDKSNNESMFMFYGWLSRFRPYFLTFRAKGDPWQTVHSWLLQIRPKVTK